MLSFSDKIPFLFRNQEQFRQVATVFLHIAGSAFSEAGQPPAAVRAVPQGPAGPGGEVVPDPTQRRPGAEAGLAAGGGRVRAEEHHLHREPGLPQGGEAGRSRWLRVCS